MTGPEWCDSMYLYYLIKGKEYFRNQIIFIAELVQALCCQSAFPAFQYG